MKDLFEFAAQRVRAAKKAIALTGAGISTESGIPDFRSKGGLWSRYDPMEYGTLGAFRRDPVKVWTMLKELLFVVDAEPNKGHNVLAHLEKTGLIQGIITQNIDGLHQKAGSTTVVEFHGSMSTFTCMSCNSTYLLDDVRRMKMPPRCECKEILKPDIVFFDEAIPLGAIEGTENLVKNADVVIVAGTSCQVVPASSIPFLVKQQGGVVIEINLEPVLESISDITLEGTFTNTMSKLAAALDL